MLNSIWRKRTDVSRPVEQGNTFRRRLDRIYLRYTFGFVAFVGLIAMLERMGMPRLWVGVTFLLATVALYAAIGIISRTTNEAEYYVAGRCVPAMYNGMATAADWMSAASFIGLAGTLYLQGYDGLAYVIGWTGGYVLVALLLAPYLRKFGQYTIPDFLGERYGGNAARLFGVFAAILCSFVYLVAQIYAVGLITSQLTGVDFVIGIFLGLGGVLVCSFLGGMRAVTWTQVAQYIILMIAYLVPVVWLSIKQTGVPVPQFVVGQQLAKIGVLEQQLMVDPMELQVRSLFQARADAYAVKLQNVPAALVAERAAAQRRVMALKAENAPLREIQASEKALRALPRNETQARESWRRAQADDVLRAQPLGGMPPHAQQFAGDPDGNAAERQAFGDSRRNFIALVFCLMVGTAALPHILMRSYTTPSVKQARESVVWSLFFISLLYVTAPALAVLVKFEVFNSLVGLPFDQLPAWIANWSKVDPSLVSVTDINKDGILQLSEFRIASDLVMLATPEIAGLPYVVSGMVAAGGLAAALSTADGLLLTISNAMSHDVYHKMLAPEASSTRRVTISKVLLLVAALAAAALATQKPAGILFLVTAAFSIAASALFPALVMGFFWSRANRWGAVLGMASGLAITLYYLIRNESWLRSLFGVSAAPHLWFGIQPVSAGVFGVPTGFLVCVVISLITQAPSDAQRRFVRRLRYPREV
ncbi:MAG: cation acetate symporter [Rhizobacter sp.]|nr:cation acetate symporter [Rhizobacter sp.]